MLGRKRQHLNKYYISKGRNKAVIFKCAFPWDICFYSELGWSIAVMNPFAPHCLFLENIVANLDL